MSKYIFFAKLFFGFHFLCAQAPLYYNLKAKHGLKTETVYALFQDANKHIWMGTEDGLIEFNGKHFKTYINKAYESEYTNVKQDSDGFIWCQNFSNQIFRLEDGELRLKYSVPPNYLIDSYLAFDVLNYPNLYINTDFGLLHYNLTTKKETIIGGTSNFKRQDPNTDNLTIKLGDKVYSNNYIQSLMIRKGDSILFHSKDTQLLYDTKQEQLVRTFHYVSEPNSTTTHILKLQDSIGYFGYDRSQKKRFFKFAPENNPSHFKDEQLEFAALFQNTDGNIWIGSRSGIHVFDTAMQKQTIFLKGNYVSDIIIDNQNNYWVSTIKNGVFVIPDFNTKLLTAPTSNLQSKRTKMEYLYAKHLNYFDNLFDDQTLFFRTHRSWMINIKFITKFDKLNNAVVIDDFSIPVSRRRMKNFQLLFS